MLPTEALRKVPILEDVEDSLLRLLTVRSREVTFEPGQVLMEEGDDGKSLYLLLEGRVAVERKNSSGEAVLIADRWAGDCFGEMSLIDGGRRSASVTAVDRCRVLIVSQDTFNQIVMAHPRAALAIMQTLVKRLREQAAELAQLKTAHAEQTPPVAG